MTRLQRTREEEMAQWLIETERRAQLELGKNLEADAARARALLAGLDHLVVQDIRLTATAALADVVLPAAASFAESDGTVTNSERRVQRMHPALDPPGEARDDLDIVFALAEEMGAGWGEADPETTWNELRSLSVMHTGMSYDRLDELGGIQWPCADLDDPGEQFLHSRLWEDPVVGPRASFHAVDWAGPADALSAEFPLRLTTGRRLDSFNTGAQSGSYNPPTRIQEGIEINAADGIRLGLDDGDLVRVVSRRGTVEATVRFDDSLVEGLAFMTFHASSEVDTNLLIADTWDPKSGTAEFKATAVRLERFRAASA
jgi:predicted molibdopterin-dependent oxidoreductase YjgC